MQAPATHFCRPSVSVVAALAVLGMLTLGSWQVLQQVRMAPGTVLPAAVWQPSQVARSSDMRPPDMTAPAPGPAWSALTLVQRQALYPLERRWPFLSELQKRRWMALAQSFTSLSEAERVKLHERMADWASLSAQQRNQARLNFATANKLAPDNKRAQWEAYQALSDEEKRRLAAGVARRSQGAATALRPVAERKLAQVPAATAQDANPINPPKIPRPTGYAPVQVPSTAASVPDVVRQVVPSVDTTVVETAPVSVPTAVPVPLPLLPAEVTSSPSSWSVPEAPPQP